MRRKLLQLLLSTVGLIGWISAEAQDITNPGFESCTAETTNWATQNTNNSADYASNGWTLTSAAAWSSSAVFAYGGTGQINGASAPATDNKGNGGNALGISVGWDGTITYQSASITLPAGMYKLSAMVYNVNNTASQMTSKLAFIPTGKDGFKSSKTSFTYGTWEEDYITFSLNEETTGVIQIGGAAISGGSGANAKVFIDNITIQEYTPENGEDFTNKIQNWDFKNCQNNNFPSWTIYAPNGGNTWANGDTRVEYWIETASNGIFDYYQTITGLPKGKYTISAKMWNSTNNEAGAQVNGNAGVYAFNGAISVFKGVTEDVGNGSMVEKTTDAIYVVDGELRLGVKNNGTMGARWFGIDWIKLTYVSNELNEADVEALIDAVPTGKMSSSIETELNNAKAALQASMTPDNYEDLLVAIKKAKGSIASNLVLEAGSLPDNSVDGWTCTNTNEFRVNTWSNEGDSDGSEMKTPFIQNWVARGSILGEGQIYYTLPGLDPGIYKVSALVRAYNEANSDIPSGGTIFANTREKDISTGTSFNFNGKGGIYDTYSILAEVGEDGLLKFGVNIKENRTFNWLAIKNCTISYVGEEVPEEEVAALSIPEGNMNATVLSNLNTAIDATSSKTIDSYYNLVEAIANANASIAAYENAAQWLPVNKAELESTNFIDPNVYKEYITDVETGLEDHTLTDEKANSLTDIRVGHHAANYIDDILLDAWDAEPMDWSTYHINTWSNEGDSDGSNFKVPFFEYWTGDANSLGEKTLTGTIEGLEPGDYAVTALVRVRVKDGNSELPNGIKMFVNNGETQPIEGTQINNSKLYLQKVSAYGTVEQDGKLTVSFDVNADNNISWLAFKNVNYVKGAASIAAFKETTEPVLVNLNNTEAFLVKDGITYIQDAEDNVGLAIKGYTISGYSENNQLLNGQLYGTASGDTLIVDPSFFGNSIIVSEGQATPKNLSTEEAAMAESTFLLATIEQVQITKEDDVNYAEDEDGKVEIDNRLCEDLVVNEGDVINTLTGITFLSEDGSNSVIAPLTQDDVVPVLWKAPSGVEVGDAIVGEDAIDLTTDDVKARIANLKAGDVLNIAVETEEDANIIVMNENGLIYAIPVSAEETNVEVPVTAFMEKDFQNHGVKITADNENLKAKYVTVRNAKYDDTENTIWLGEGNDVTLGMQHFGDVREGDMLEAEGEEIVMAVGEEEIESGDLTEEQAAILLNKYLTVSGATKVTFTLGDDMREDITDTEEGESFNQGEKDLTVNGMIMTFGGNDPEGEAYEFSEAYPSVNNFKAGTEGINTFPVDDEDKAYDPEQKNLPTKGTYYVFEPTKDGQLEVTVDLEKGKKLFVTEDGEALKDFNGIKEVEGNKISFPVEATKTYYVFANETNLGFYGYQFKLKYPNAKNVAKDIATFKLLYNSSVEGDTLLLNDAIVNYIHGDDVFVEDATGAIDFYQTYIQYYEGQKLNGYIVGTFDIKDNMPVLLRTDGTKYGQFKVTDKVKPEAAAATIADVTKEENLARFMKLEYVEITKNERGLKVFADIETGEQTLVEDRFGVFYKLGDLLEKVEGIVGINEEGNFAFWPTSKEGTVVSDGFKKTVETELDVTNKDEAKTKNNPVVGISVTLDGACNAGSGSSMAGAMTSKGYKLRTANGSPDKNSAKFTVNDNQKVFDMTINAVANYAAKDTEKPCITVTKVEVDGKEVSFEGGEFPAKGASDCGSLILKGINAEKDIVIYFDNSNAEGTQLNMAYAITCRGEKVFTTKEADLIAKAKELAEDREAVAVGCLDDAIEEAEAGFTDGLQAAIDQFLADNADLEKDETSKVGIGDEWKKFEGDQAAGVCATQYAPAIMTYDGRTAQMRENYEGTTATVGQIIYQKITGLANGTYKVGFYANAFFTSGRGFDSPMADGALDVAYVFANDMKDFIPGLIATSTKENSKRQFTVEVTDGTIKLGLGKAKAGTNWHTIQIDQLTWFTTAKAAYAAEKADLVATLEEANEQLATDQFGGRAKLEAAVAEANEAKESIRLNIDGMTAEVAKLKAAIEKFKAAGKVFIQNVATGKYLAAGESWGTQVVLNDVGLDYAITTNADGTKNFDSQVSNGGNSHFLNTDPLYNDQPAFGWTVEQLSNGNYTISNGTQYLGAGEGNLAALVDNAEEWRIITVDERTEALAAATSEAPVDATFLIKGANFGRNDQRNNSWEVSKDCTNKNLSGGNNSNNCAESYHSTFTISQIVADAPAGTYVLKAQGFYRQDGDAAEDVPVFFANDEKQEFGPLTGTENNMTQASESFTSGNYQLQSITVIVEEDGTLTIGVQGTAKNQWVIWDNFQLFYYGVGGEPTTAINEVNEKAEPAARNSFEDGAVYNLRGQKMEGTLKPGLYIKNGRKFVVK